MGFKYKFGFSTVQCVQSRQIILATRMMDSIVDSDIFIAIGGVPKLCAAQPFPIKYIKIQIPIEESLWFILSYFKIRIMGKYLNKIDITNFYYSSTGITLYIYIYILSNTVIIGTYRSTNVINSMYNEVILPTTSLDFFFTVFYQLTLSFRIFKLTILTIVS